MGNIFGVCIFLVVQLIAAVLIHKVYFKHLLKEDKRLKVLKKEIEDRSLFFSLQEQINESNLKKINNFIDLHNKEATSEIDLMFHYSSYKNSLKDVFDSISPNFKGQDVVYVEGYVESSVTKINNKFSFSGNLDMLHASVVNLVEDLIRRCIFQSYDSILFVLHFSAPIKVEDKVVVIEKVVEVEKITKKESAVEKVIDDRNLIDAKIEIAVEEYMTKVKANNVF